MGLVQRAVAAALCVPLTAVPGSACPRAGSDAPVTLERADSQTEVTQRLPLVITATTFRNAPAATVTYYQGLIEIERKQRDTVRVVRPTTPLDGFFPIRPNGTMRFEAETGEDGKPLSRITRELAVIGARKLSVGDCVIDVWIIESRRPGALSNLQTEVTLYYSAEWKLIVAREYLNRNGDREVVAYSRISQK